MTEQEKREFARRNAAAEAQLHQLYYGRPDRKKSTDSLTMPDFLVPPKQPKNKAKEPAPKQAPTPPTAPPKPAVPNKTNGMNLLQLLNFKGIQMDQDRLIILALCILLSSEEADELLLLALLYIML